MERSSKGHMEEAVNLRSFYLRLLEKIWIIPVAAIIGAILCAGIYTLVTVTFGPAKTYSANAKLYISFAFDENKYLSRLPKISIYLNLLIESLRFILPLLTPFAL